VSETRNVFVRISERDKESSPIISLEFIVHHHTHSVLWPKYTYLFLFCVDDTPKCMCVSQQGLESTQDV
jgi:hypothetical protein